MRSNIAAKFGITKKPASGFQNSKRVLKPFSGHLAQAI